MKQCQAIFKTFLDEQPQQKKKANLRLNNIERE